MQATDSYPTTSYTARSIYRKVDNASTSDSPKKKSREMQDVLSQHLPSFYRRAYRYLGNVADAEDAVQDALLSACRHLDQFQGAIENVDLVDLHCHQFCPDAIAGDAHVSPTRPLDERLGEDEKYCVSDRLADSRPSPEDECVEADLHGRFEAIHNKAFAFVAQGIRVA